ncbi:MAG: ATP synthase F1 subunit delta [Ignavibacteria bacterium]|nr:ATP synthase F1 subunit delta [Ignavibacteria bacterium]
MAEQRVSYRYAKALFETSCEEKCEEVVYNDFMIISKILTFVPELVSIARKPLVSPFRKKRLYQEVFSEKISETTLKFILFLVDKERDYLLKDIIAQYQKLYFAYKNLLPVEIYFPRDFEDSLKHKIIHKLEEITGKKVIPKFIIDPKILGGFKVKIEDWVFDATLKNKLLSLYKELVSNVKVEQN